jgi:outer membrane receptor protein involved in Fe transport
MGFYASYAQGYVPPQVTELFNNVKVPFLMPQIFHNYEIGGWWHLYQNSVAIDWSLYRMLGTHEIISVRNADGSSENKNAGKTAHTGLELGLNYQPDHQLQIRLGGTAARHTFKTETQNGVLLDGKQMQAAPGFIANGSLTYRPDFAKGLYIQPEYQRVGSYFMDDANTAKYKGYNLLNLRAGYQWHKAEIWANALNVLNRYYATVATKSSYGYSYNLGMPFTLAIGLAFHF